MNCHVCGTRPIAKVTVRSPQASTRAGTELWCEWCRDRFTAACRNRAWTPETWRIHLTEPCAKCGMAWRANIHPETPVDEHAWCSGCRKGSRDTRYALRQKQQSSFI